MLYVIPTPVGNKEDITLRAIRLFKELKYFLCEDTRTIRSLFKLYEIPYEDKQFLALTSFTHQGKMNHYMNILKENDVGLVSEAGTPGLSDPGKELVRLCRENQIKFEVLPGATALIPAVVGTYTDTSEFVFLGFLPTKKGRQTKMKEIIASDRPVFVYESVHRILKCMEEMKSLGFEGNVSIYREGSKMFEQKENGKVDEIIEKLKSGAIVSKGEFVVGFYK